MDLARHSADHRGMLSDNFLLERSHLANKPQTRRGTNTTRFEQSSSEYSPEKRPMAA